LLSSNRNRQRDAHLASRGHEALGSSVDKQWGDVMDLSTPRKQRDFIKATWPHFAAVAWQKYRQLGRGAIVIVVGERPARPGSWQVELFRYMPYRAGKPPFTLAIIDVARSYNPREGIVVIVVTRLTGPRNTGEIETEFIVKTYYVETPPGQPTPPEALKLAEPE
jgi:hypothetical protein